VGTSLEYIGQLLVSRSLGQGHKRHASVNIDICQWSTFSWRAVLVGYGITSDIDLLSLTFDFLTLNWYHKLSTLWESMKYGW